MGLEVVSIVDFDISVLALGDSPAVQATIAEMLVRILGQPSHAPRLRGGISPARVLRAPARGTCPPLRIVYQYDPSKEIVYLYFASVYDELRELLEGSEHGFA